MDEDPVYAQLSAQASGMEVDRHYCEIPVGNKIRRYVCNLNVNKAALAFDNAFVCAPIFKEEQWSKGGSPHPSICLE